MKECDVPAGGFGSPIGSLSRVAADAYPGAALMLSRGAEDYLAARWCLLSHLDSGRQLAAQALEKTMKGMLCFCDVKRFSGSIHGHNLRKINAELRQRGLSCTFDDEDVLTHFEGHYNLRYPDAQVSAQPSAIGCSEEARMLDAAIFYLWERMPRRVAAVHFSLLRYIDDRRFHYHDIMLTKNEHALEWRSLKARLQVEHDRDDQLRKSMWSLPDEQLEPHVREGEPAISVPIETIFARHILKIRNWQRFHQN